MGFDDVVIAEDTQAIVIGVSAHFRDPEGKALTFKVERFEPITAILTGDAIFITPPPNYFGMVEGRVYACDPTNKCSWETVLVSVTPVRDPPNVEFPFQPVTIVQGGAVTVTGVSSHFNDVDGDALTFSVSGFSRVTAALTGNNIDLLAPADWLGTETGSVKGCDPSGACATTSLAVTVTTPPSGNRPPVVSSGFDPVSAPEDTVTSVSASGHFTEPDGEPLNYIVSGFTSVATIVSGSQIQISAPTNWNGSETGSVRACDPLGLCASTPLSVTFTPVNDAPTVENSFPVVTIAQGGAATVTGVSSHFKDVDGDPLTYSVMGFAQVSAVINGDNIDVQAPSGWTGTEYGTVYGCDPSGACADDPLIVTTEEVAGPTSMVVLAYNDLGMHFMSDDYSELMILPPYNNLHATVIDTTGSTPVIVQSGVTVEYSIRGNTWSAGKINFWNYDLQLLGVNLPTDVGMAGKGLSGVMTATGNGDFAAEGIPLTPMLDNLTLDPYPMADVVAVSGGQDAGYTETVVAVSWQIRCDACHSSSTTWEADVLRRHDSKVGTNLQTRKPVACGECHAQGPNGAFMPGMSGRPNFSRAIHSSHARRVEGQFAQPCYACHPGTLGDSLRGAHKQAGLVCGDCHGTMAEVGAGSRDPWIDEPRCGDCHSRPGFQFEQAGTLYKDSIGHNGVRCIACHGSPHAITPSTLDRDNIQSLNYQGYEGPIGNDCMVCHSQTPGTFNHTP